jgi:ABC-type transport system involved in cytochrome c biogenesis permease subunit
MVVFFIRDLFYIAALFYLLAYLLTWGPAVFCSGKWMFFFRCLLCAGLFANFLSAAGRYYFSWPMMPMYQAPFFLPFVIGIFSFKTIWHKQAGWRLLVSAICILSLAAVFFPNDFYLPFLKSKTSFSHLYLLFGVVGKACFLIAGIKAMVYLINYYSDKQSFDRKIQHPFSLKEDDRTAGWIIMGFVFWTLSMFAGAIWSYLGWGCPVVWDDPSITATMATWFFYICFLHLHLTRFRSLPMLNWCALTGALLVLILNCGHEIGPFRLPL